MFNIPKKQLRSDMKITNKMIAAYGGETYLFELQDAGVTGLDGLIECHGELITLFEVRDATAVALDFLRGSGEAEQEDLGTESINNTESKVMDMKIEVSEPKETVACGSQNMNVPAAATELTAKEGSPKDRAIRGILESFIDRTFSKDQKEKYPIDSLVEKTKMITDMVGASDLVSHMLAVQLVAVHDLQTAIIARAFKNPDNQQAVSMATKLANTFIQQIGMMERLRGQGQQKVVVEHVHVHAGGQAVVGNITGGG